MDEDEGAGGPADLAEENARLRALIAEMQARVVELERLADTDPLTPLPNRRPFLRELERAAALGGGQASTAALLYIDIDGLKAINDAHGHGAGDAALVHVAGLLAKLVRPSDLAARIGGDEFALILHGCEPQKAAEEAERIARFIAATPVEVEGKTVTLRASVGTAMIRSGDTAEEAMRRADRDMYLAKREERYRSFR